MYKFNQILIEKNAVQIDTQNLFTWASGLKSPIYCDNRKLISTHIDRVYIISEMVKLLKSFPNFDIIAGTATAGIPWGAWLAHELKKEFIYVRSKSKEHGTKSLLEGSFKAGQKVLVIEDLISTGGSSISAVSALQSDNLVVIGVAALFSYNLKKAEINFKEINIPYKSLSNINLLLADLLAESKVSSQDIKFVENFINNAPI